jgi:uncharacterized protein YprB with RNaseH-like and TPR domain
MPAMTAPDPKPSLSDKLKALGVKVGTADLRPTPASQGYPIERVVDGRSVETPLGQSFSAVQVFDAHYRHGLAAIRPDGPFPLLSAWAQEPRFRELPLEAYAFLDTETSGLAGGTGTYAFLIGVGRFIDGRFRLEQFFMHDPSGEPALLEALAEFLAPCQALVSFNGKAFDAPLLKTRYVLHTLPCPFDGFAHLDLLPLARRLWRDRLPSRALKYLEENILEAPRTAEEVPGYEIPYLYFDYLRSGDARPLKGVFYHNAMDVVAMAALLTHVHEMLTDPFNERIAHGLDVVAMARLYEDLGELETAVRLFEHGLEMNLPEADFWLAIQRLSRLQKRRGDVETAVRLWERAAMQGHIYAHVELAKYFEHQLRNYEEALRWTDSAMQHVAEQDIPRYVRDHWLQELTHRRERIQNKIRP